MKKILLGMTLLTSLTSYGWVEERTELVKCNRVDSQAEISFNLIKDYDNVEDQTSMGFEISSARKSSSHIHVQSSVLDLDFPISYYGITNTSNTSDKIHYRMVSFPEIDLTDTTLINGMNPPISNLEVLKKYGRTQVVEFIVDKKSGKGVVRSLQAIGHSATVLDELYDYKVEGCSVKEEIPTEYLSAHPSFDKL